MALTVLTTAKGITAFRRRARGWVALGVAMLAAACAPPNDADAPPTGGVLLTLGAPPVRERPYVDHRLVTAWPRDVEQMRTLWRLSEVILSPHDPVLGEHQLMITPATLERVLAAGVPLRVEPVDVQAMVDAEFEQPATLAHAAQAGKLGIFGPYFSKVQQLDAIFAYLDELVAASAGRAQIVNLGKSIQNRDVRAIRVSSAPEGTDRASVIITGTQHAREWASPMVTSGFADALVRQYGVDPRVTKVVNTLEIFVIPVTNPDGYVASHNGRRMQRKNMNARCNVDLNRNWGEWWGMGTPVNGCGEETYPGQSAFSEPETAAVRKLADSRKKLRFYMDYHSAANQVMYPLCFIETRSPEVDEDRAWTQAYAQAFATVNNARIPSQSCYGIGGGEGGCSTDYFRRRLPNGIEVELRPGQSLFGFGLTDDLVMPFVEENWAGWITVLEKVADKYPLPVTPGADAGGPDSGAASDAGTSPDSEAGADRPAPYEALPPPPDTAPSPPEPAADAAAPPQQPPLGEPGEGGCAVAAGRASDVSAAWALLAVLMLLRLPLVRRGAGTGPLVHMTSSGQAARGASLVRGACPGRWRATRRTGACRQL